MENYIGKICPFCNTEIKEGEEVKVCPACEVPHHATCWEENKGCTTFGCSEQHHEEQGTNPTSVCSNCGEPLGDGQGFCPKCGTKKEVVEEKQPNVCAGCGAQMAEGQEFCSSCGQKATVAVAPEFANAVDQFNQNVVAPQKKKFKPMTIIAIAIAAILVVVVGSKLVNNFDGEYLYVSGDSYYSYTFEDGEYEYESDDDSEEGTYEVDKDSVTITDEDGDETEFIRVGKYICNKKTRYENDIDVDCDEEQTLEKNSDFTYKGYSYEAKIQLTLYEDGTYEYTFDLHGSYSSSNISEEEGEYRIEGNKLILSPDGEDHEEILLIVDGKVHDSVYEKQ